MFRTARLPRELLNKSGRHIRVRVGRPIPVAEFPALSGDREVTEYLRWRTYLLDDSEKVHISAPFAIVSQACTDCRRVSAESTGGRGCASERRSKAVRIGRSFRVRGGCRRDSARAA